MKRIGILTFHRAINYGAYLQSYSLQNYINDHFPDCNTEIIDYIPNIEYKKIFRNILGTLKRKGLFECHREIKKVCVFQKSLAYQKLSDLHMKKDDFNRLFHYIDSHYDVVVVGSDAILNWNQNGFPSAYYLDYNFNVPMIMYAASAHGLKYFDINEQQKAYCKRCFSRFSLLGIRDENTENFIHYCNPELNTIHTCDPTFLIDKKKVLEIAADTQKIAKRKYHFSFDQQYIVTMVNNEILQKKIRDEFGEKYTIVSLFKPNRYSDVFMYDLNPFQWVYVLAHANLVITQYFHGALLSMRYGTSTMVVDAANPEDNYISKLYDVIVNRLSFYDRYSTEKDLLCGNTDFWTTANQLVCTDESEMINAKMDREAESSNAYFEMVKSLLEHECKKGD